MAASLVIHGLIVLWLWQASSPSLPSEGYRLVEIEMLPSDHDVNDHNAARKAPPAFTKSPAKPPKVEIARHDSSISAKTETAAPDPTPKIAKASTVADDHAVASMTAVAGAVDHPAADRQQDEGNAGETMELVRQHLEAHKFYPASARRRGVAGEVEIGFRLDRLGMAADIMVLASSGYDLLDWAARETIRRAQPFPAAERTFRFRLRFRKL